VRAKNSPSSSWLYLNYDDEVVRALIGFTRHCIYRQGKRNTNNMKLLGARYEKLPKLIHAQLVNAAVLLFYTVEQQLSTLQSYPGCNKLGSRQIGKGT
jgi:hypothetical protein